MKTNLASHFRFGENWSEFSRQVTNNNLEFAKQDLEKLLLTKDLSGINLCDIGCGSGIHSIAAAKMGAKVTAIDIDPLCTLTTNQLAETFRVNDSVSVRNDSIFEHTLDNQKFEVVYSWGVLHHTGDMWRALSIAIDLLSTDSGSIFAVALYRRTRLCNFWKAEKKFYKDAGKPIQFFMRTVFAVLVDMANLARLRGPIKYRRNYRSRRGMSRKHDVHDWLGGYPYESIVESELIEFFESKGLLLRNSITRYPGKTPLGLFGSGCDEYVFARI